LNHCIANLTVYLFESAHLRSVDRHLRYPGKLRRPSCPVARYFCSVCNFFDDSEDRDVYHCPFCNVCRRGKGLGKDFFHCMQCNSCVSLTMGPHKCPGGGAGGGNGGGGGGGGGGDCGDIAGAGAGSGGGGGGWGSGEGPGPMESDCPVCKDFLFTSNTPVKCLPCGHFMAGPAA